MTESYTEGARYSCTICGWSTWARSIDAARRYHRDIHWARNTKCTGNLVNAEELLTAKAGKIVAESLIEAIFGKKPATSISNSSDIGNPDNDGTKSYVADDFGTSEWGF